jgi:hypothetical protein
MLDQRLGLGAVLRADRDPDAGRDAHLLTIEHEGPGQRCEDLLGEHARAARLVEPGLDQG